jgi:SAM-dependent methyltransferase/uncharacterized protein YbaR (Trm112 family)
MKPTILPLLACPECHGSLTLEVDGEPSGEIESGRLVCAACPRDYPIVRGVPRFVPAPEPGVVERTSRRFGGQWQHFRERFHEFREAFLDWVLPLQPEDFAGRVVLDAGCGMGRFAEVAASFGAQAVVGVDLSEAVEVAHEAARDRNNLHIVQADLRRLPLAREFDLLYTLGVLHHMPDGAQGLADMAQVVRPGGRVQIWVYGREGNEWLLRWVDPLRRKLTSRLPFPLLWLLSFVIALKLHFVLVVLYRPAARSGGRRWLPYRPYFTWLAGFPWRHTHQVVFDHLGAPLARYLARPEVEEWLRGAGLTDLEITPRNANSWRGGGRVSEPDPRPTP